MANMDGEYEGIPGIFKEMVAHPDDKSNIAEADLIPIEKLDGALAYFSVRSCKREAWYIRMQTYTDDRKANERARKADAGTRGDEAGMDEAVKHLKVVISDDLKRLDLKLVENAAKIREDLVSSGSFYSTAHIERMRKLYQGNVDALQRAMIANIAKVGSESSAAKLTKAAQEQIKKYSFDKLRRQISNHEESIRALGQKLSFPTVPKLAFDANEAICSMNARLELMQSNLNTRPLVPKQEGPTFVDDTRLKELKSIKTEKYDLQRLVRLCEELNICYQTGSYMAVAMLTRAVLDHVPPIFNCATFSGVANNYKGSRSFKDTAASLDTISRKIADAHLHTQIREQEVLPSAVQVNVSHGLDMILSEIVRILR